MSQTETVKAVAADEPTEAVRSFVRTGEKAATRRKYTPEGKVRIVLEGFRREVTVSDLCRREGIKPHSYYSWTKEFMEAGKEKFDSLVTRPVSDEPWRANEVWSGRRPRDAGCWPHRTICRAQDKRDPLLRYPFRGSGHPVEAVERRPHDTPSTGRDRRYRPDRPLSRVLHLHQACMDHPLEVARQRLQVDGKPHPTAPSHPQAPKPVGALQLGVRSLDTSPYVIPLAPLLGGLGPPAPLDVHLHQVRLEDVGPRTLVQLHWATGSQGAGLACCPGKVDLYPLRRIRSARTPLMDGWPAGHTVACSPVTSI